MVKSSNTMRLFTKIASFFSFHSHTRLTAMATAKTVNYTPEMEAAIRAAAPITFDSAGVLAERMGKPARSIIAKAKSLGVEYIAKPAPAKRVTGSVSKAEVVASISAKLGGIDLSGLDKATSAALAALDGAIQ